MSGILDKYSDFIGKPEEMAMLCAILLKRGLHEDALLVGMEATTAAPESRAIREAVTNALSSGVAKFHIPMLLDEARNRAYVKAIEKAVLPGMRVLEIGTGAGLLAMTAARMGADVVTCEEHPTIAAAASQIVGRNGLSSRIRIVSKRSTDMSIPGDMTEPADLVIHEIFGSGLFDEGVTAAMSDARKRLLRPEAPSIPPRAMVRCMLVREGSPRNRDALRDVEGFDLSIFGLLARTTMSSSAFRHLALEPASQPHSGLAMDYGSAAPFGPDLETIEIESLGGRVDGVAQWIALDFGDGEKLENDPFNGGPASSWGARYLPMIAPCESAPGDVFDVTLSHRRTTLSCEAVRRGPAPRN